ncbi:MerR family transcriptional regulator [Bacillus sp. NPDC060175]|uniref:MerR family transcriptional regulator n=1 Tax=Bacillus sp. NPDC060175 TaxID=3347061 RepID=UPI003657AA1C
MLCKESDNVGPCFQNTQFLKSLYIGIEEMSRVTGITEKKLRDWEKNGIISSFTHKIEGIRIYNYSNIKKVILIKEILDDGCDLNTAVEKVEKRISNINEKFRMLKGISPHNIT